MSLKLVQMAKCFGGEQRIYSHFSETLKCTMHLSVYMPPQAFASNTELPAIYFLSGLTRTHDYFIKRSGVQRYASKHGICVVNPDTSPRGLNVPGEHGMYDLGAGASFYLNATKEPWAENYRMFSYVNSELIDVVSKHLPVVKDKQSIMGHSMGGHGALISALKNPGLYASVSVFGALCNPIESTYGQDMFRGYIGDDEEEWKEWDATVLASNYSDLPCEIFLDQGTNDLYLNHLLPGNFVSAVEENDQLQIIYMQRDGYDHSYNFVSTFLGEHIDYHAKFLKSENDINDTNT